MPEDFGTVGMSLIIIGLVSIVNESGLTTSIIQRKDLKDSHLYTAFWTNIITGFLLYAATFFLSPFIADFFNNDYVELVIKVASLSFLISSVTIVHRSLLSKNLRFKAIATTEIIGSFISGIFALYLALSGFGLWSLVAKNLINDLVVVLLTLIIYPWKPSLQFSKTKFYELFGFGFNVICSNLLGYFRQNLDYIIIGRFMGAELLGYYTLAYTLASFPATKITPIITRVVFPTFSLLQDDITRFKKGYMKLVSSLALITIPSLIGLALVATELIIQVYGEKWSPSIVPLQILCLLGLIDSISDTSRSVFYSKGFPEIELKLNAMKIMISAIVIYVGSFYGIVGVAASLSLVSIFYFIFTQKIVNQIISLSWIHYFEGIKVPLFAAIIMGLVISIYKYRIHFENSSSTLTILITSIIIGVTIYSFVVYKLNIEINTIVKKYLKNINRKKFHSLVKRS
jgi:PST family polysaccharide transporter